MWSLKAPPSHSGFTLDAHLLWSYGGEEKQKHKNCGRRPSVELVTSHVTSMKHNTSGEYMLTLFTDCLTRSAVQCRANQKVIYLYYYEEFNFYDEMRTVALRT